MKTEDILNLDCRKEENKKIIQKVLRKIKPLSKYSDECEIPLEAIEKLLAVMCKKYCVNIKEITANVLANDKQIIWKATIINENEFALLNYVYGISIYEVLSKSTIYIYTKVKKGIKIRDKGGS